MYWHRVNPSVRNFSCFAALACVVFLIGNFEADAQTSREKNRPDPSNADANVSAPFMQESPAISCRGCNTQLTLSRDEFRCLRHDILPTLRDQKTNPLIFKLDYDSCPRAKSVFGQGFGALGGGSSRSRIPEENAKADEIYILVMEQLTCLEAQVKDPTVVDEKYILDLSRACE